MKSFKYALEGIAYAVKTQRNMRIHLCFAFYVVIAGLVTEISLCQWAAVLLCIALVTALELINTAVESACDEMTREHSENIKRAKDASAGAVLLAAAVSAVVGASVFFTGGRPRLALEFAMENKPAAGIIVLSLPLWIIFITKVRRPEK